VKLYIEHSLSRSLEQLPNSKAMGQHTPRTAVGFVSGDLFPTLDAHCPVRCLLSGSVEPYVEISPC